MDVLHPSLNRFFLRALRQNLSLSAALSSLPSFMYSRASPAWPEHKSVLLQLYEQRILGPLLDFNYKQGIRKDIKHGHARTSSINISVVHPNPESDTDPNLQISSDPPGSGCTTLMFMLLVRACSCFMSLLNVHAECPCWMSNTECPCCLSMIDCACPCLCCRECSKNMLHV